MIPFKLPPPEGFLDPPVWNGKYFEIDGNSSSVLEYSENFSGWSDDLTSLHEDAVGGGHPIDMASRSDAIRQISQCIVGKDSPVIMEIGCSSGFLMKDMIKSFPDATIIGADVVKAPLFKLAEQMPGLPLLRFDLLRCPLPDQAVDVLVMLNVLEHIEDDVEALKKAFNLLKIDGYLVIEVPAGRALYDNYDAELMHFRRYTSQELAAKLNDAGFEVVRKSHLACFVFPAFASVKLINKIFASNNKRTSSTVSKQAGKTASSKLIKWLLDLEAKYFAKVSLPFGIRVLMVAKRTK